MQQLVISLYFLLACTIAPNALAQNKKPAQPASSSSVQKEEKSEADNPRARMDYFYQQRAYPYGFIPAGARLKALERLEEMRATERAREAPLPDALARAAALPGWTNIGPQPTSTGFSVGNVAGRVSALAVDPTNPDIVYLGGAQGGVWKTTDGGVTWTPLTESEASLAIGSIAIDPTSCSPAPCRTIYVGTGEQTFSGSSYYGAGILKSTDGGMTWTQLGQSTFVGPFSGGFSPGGGARIGSIAVHPTNGNIILAGVLIFVSADTGTSSGIYRSTDAGVTWTNVRPGAAGTEVLFDPTNGNIAYGGLGSTFFDPDNGIYKSTDAGMTWTKLAGGLPTTDLGRIELAIAPSTPSTLYASIADAATGSSDVLGVFKTTNGGTTWTRLTAAPNYCTPQCWYDNVIRAHPLNANVVYVGGGPSNFFMISNDGGTIWNAGMQGPNGNRLHVDQHAIAFGMTGVMTSRLYVGNDGGVWSANLATPTTMPDWTNLNSTLSITQFYPGHSIHPSDERVSLGGTQDNGTQRFNGNQGTFQWEEIACGDGGWTAIDHAAPSTWYATCQRIAIFRSLQNGAAGTFFSARAGIDPSDLGAFIPPFIIDPNISQRLYFGTFRVWQTNNGASTWTAISPDLTGGFGTLRTIAVAPSNSGVVYTGSSFGRVFRTSNAGAGAGATWTDLTTTDLPTRLVTMIAVHPMNPDIAYATFSGFGTCSGVVTCDGKGHVFRTLDGGGLWTDVSIAPFSATPLPDSPANDLVIDPADPAGVTLYVATDVGVFTTSDGGVNWMTMVSGLPRVAVLSLKLRQPSRTLRAATHGRGVWDFQLGNLPAYNLSAISPSTAAPADPDFTLSVRGNGFTFSSIIRWNGADQTPTIFVDSQNLNVLIPSSLLVGGPPAQVTVFDPDPIKQSTNPLLFTVLNPAPATISISPTTVASGGGAPVPLTVNGTNFVANSEVRFNGSPRATSFVSATQLDTTLAASDTAASGIHQITVFTPTPGGGTSNSQTFTVTGPPPLNDNFSSAISVGAIPFTDSQNNGFATTEPGEPSPGSIAACTSASNAHSIWYRLMPAASGIATVDTIGSVYDSVLSVWTGSAVGALNSVACDDDGVAPGGPSRLSVNLAAGTTYHFMVSGFDPTQSGATSFNFSFLAAPPNDNFFESTVITASAFTDSPNTSAASTENADPAPSCAIGAASSGRAKSVWYRVTLSANDTITANTLGSNYDTILSAFTGSQGAFSEIACNDDSVGLQSQVSFSATQGTTYHLMITDFSGVGGSTVFNFTATVAPSADYTMSSMPGSLTVNRGQSAMSTITITPVGGAFSSPITFSCSGLPSQSTCSFSPTSVTPGMNPATTTVTITTRAAGAIPSPAARLQPPAPLVLLWLVSVLCCLLALGLLGREAKRRRLAAGVALAAAFAVAALQVACGGGGGGSGPPPPPPNPGTPIGTFTVNVTGTSGGNQRATPITLTVR